MRETTVDSWLLDIGEALDASATFARAVSKSPDPWQVDLLNAIAAPDTNPVTMALCSRQVGKSQTVAVGVYRRAEYYPGSTILVLAPALRQSQELHLKIKAVRAALGSTHEAEKDTQSELTLTNGSRIIVVPANEETIRGYTCDLIVLDEAARIDDKEFNAIIPMLRDDGALVATTTPYGQRGWFWEAWKEGRGTCITARSVDLPRKARAVQRDRAIMSPSQFAQEHLLAFIGSGDPFFNIEDFDRAIDPMETALCL